MKSKKKEKIEESKPVDEDEESEGSIQDMRDIFLTQLSKQRRCSYDITWPMLNFNDPNSTYKGKGIFKDCKEDEKHFKNIFESSFQSKETFDEEKFNEFLFLYEDSKAKSKNEKGRKFSISERKLDFYDDFLI